jgi:hypothetical protein
MSKLTCLTVFLGGILALATPAAAQATDQTVEVDRVDTVDHVATGRPMPGGGFRVPEGVRMVSPGALLFASFDRDYDGKITLAEVEAGAAGAFTAADRNQDGAVTGFEQSDWAARIGATGDILTNSMTFDVDLDRSVSRVEFISGLKRLAGQIAPGDISFADLVKPLKADEKGERGPGGFGTLVPRVGGSYPGGDPRGDRPNAGVQR